jgi:hypothetical protein
MQYLLTLHFRQGEGPQEGTPEFDAEMARWGGDRRARGSPRRSAHPDLLRPQPADPRRGDGAHGHGVGGRQHELAASAIAG